MADVQLLNPTPDADASKAMILVAQRRLAVLEEELTQVVLERDKYLTKIGAVLELRRLTKELGMEYSRRFEV